MIFALIWLVVLLIVGRILFRGSPRQGNAVNIVPPVITDVEPSLPYWQKDPEFSPLARDRLETLETWEKSNADPDFPPPIPPSHPHPYFGGESDHEAK